MWQDRKQVYLLTVTGASLFQSLPARPDPHVARSYHVEIDKQENRPV
jgi:hypothetical protein